jgi:hypothetical protein
MSTNFLVTQAQRDLALAEVGELRAIADYGKSLIDFELVQEAGVGSGSGISITGGGSTTGTTQQPGQQSTLQTGVQSLGPN